MEEGFRQAWRGENREAKCLCSVGSVGLQTCVWGHLRALCKGQDCLGSDFHEQGRGKERPESTTVLPAKIHLSYQPVSVPPLVCVPCMSGIASLDCGHGGAFHGEWFSPTGSAAVLPLQSPTALWQNCSGWGQSEVTSVAHPQGSCLTYVTSHRAVPGPPCSTLLIPFSSLASSRLCYSSRNCRMCSQVNSPALLGAADPARMCLMQ